MMNRNFIKQAIEENKNTITGLLGGNPINRLNSLNWIRHEISNETKILFQYPDYMPKNKKSLYLDYNQIRNLGDAWDYILKNQRAEKIDNFEFRKIHSMISKNTDIPSGVYRNSDIFIEQLGVHAPQSHKIIYQISDIEYNIGRDDINPLTRAFDAHYNLIALQPFNDFNKRTARMVMNWVLLKNGHVPILFNHKSDKQEYMDALRARADGDKKTYSCYLYCCLHRTQENMKKILRSR